MRNENDVQKILDTFNGKLLSNAFYIPDDIIDNKVPLPLSNLATGVVLPNAKANRLLNAADLGKQSMESFVLSRVQSKEVNFWDPIHKLKVKSFSSVAKSVTIKSQKEKIVSINADRKLFGQLLVAAKNREINLKKNTFL